MVDVEFHDYSMQVKAAINDAALQFLEEAASEIETQTIRNMDKADANDTTALKRSWRHYVDAAKGEAVVGSPLENAVYTEFGTGEYAYNGKGRKGGWYVSGDKLTPKAKSRMRKRTLKNGKELYFTRGKKPVRMLHNAFVSKKNAIARRAQQIFKEELK